MGSWSIKIANFPFSMIGSQLLILQPEKSELHSVVGGILQKNQARIEVVVSVEIGSGNDTAPFITRSINCLVETD